MPAMPTKLIDETRVKMRLVLRQLLAATYETAPANPDAAPQVQFVKSGDRTMQSAIAHARRELAHFIQVVREARPWHSFLAIKVPFKDGDTVEHLWVTDLRYQDRRFHGRIDNDPQFVTHVRLGDRVMIDPGSISDWVYADEGRLVGGFTLRVLRNTLSDDERRQFDEMLPYRVE